MAKKIKDIRYLNKDFGQYKESLINFAKTYFPSTYNDFNESSPGMMFIEMASYVGDVLSYYTDMSLKENFLNHASDNRSLFDIANSRGFKIKNTTSATCNLDVYQIVPSIGSGENIRPDYNYSLIVPNDSVIGSQTNQGVEFRTTRLVDFSYSSSIDPTDVTVYRRDDVSNEPTYYLLKKSVQAVSGNIRTRIFSFNDPIQYDKVLINDDNIISIVSVTDSDNNKWYEVPFLSQDTIFERVENKIENDKDLYQYRNEGTPYLLKLKKVPRRFVTEYNSDGTVELKFGSGISDEDDENLVPNPDLVGSNLYDVQKTGDISLDPSNFLYTKTYGVAPQNTELTVQYAIGNGVTDNVPSNDLTENISVDLEAKESNLDLDLLNEIKRSIAFNNPEPASGGKSGEDENEIRENVAAHFAAQNRVVTKEDYLIRAYSMPAIYGAIAKAHVIQAEQKNKTDNYYIPNQLAIDLYVLGYDNDNKLTHLNLATKENLKTYLSFYRILTDSVFIKDAYIINIGVNYEIIPLPEYNTQEVLLKCNEKAIEYFNIKKWQINEPIIISKFRSELDKVEGVQSVVDIQIVNLYDENAGYSNIKYDIGSATRNNIIYPSIDPSIFEVKFPKQDIKGRIRNI